DVAAEPFPGWTEPTLREWSRGAIRARARFPRQSTSPPAAIPKASAQSQYAYGKGVPLPQRRRLEPACIHCLRADQQKSIPSPEWWYVLQFACVWTQLKHGSAGNDWEGPCLHVEVPAVGALFQYKANRTGCLR